ncbi:MAG TPA: FecR domain-containing protein [Pirellulales bacterium]|jgi:hypothetical protein|nr:FecR domain-containing protein [Pirellulales bacterium]
MDCSAALDLLNAWLDGEIEASDRTALEAHLAGCGDCRAAADALKLQDAELLRAFARRRLAVESVSHSAIVAIARETGRVRAPRGWSSLVTAAAAGFLLAVGLLRPWGTSREAPPLRVEAPPLVESVRPIVRLALATGPTEVRPAQDMAGGPIPWFTCPESSSIEFPACVRTGADTCCELDTTDGCQLRLNADTEVRLKQPRRVELDHGQLWSSVAEGERPFEIETADAQVSASCAKFDLRCPSDETVLTVVEGEATVQSGGAVRNVAAGEQVTIVGGRISEEHHLADPLFDTRWIHDLLVLKGQNDPELAGRLNDLLAQIGRAKLSLMYEDEIRRLGEPAVWPLLRFLSSSGADDEPQTRAIAARIAADLAPPRAVPELIELLADQNAQVRAEIARALERLTGRDQGRPADQWRADWLSCEPTQLQWRQWWAERQRRNPPSPSESPSANPRQNEPMQKARSPSEGAEPGKS